MSHFSINHLINYCVEHILLCLAGKNIGEAEKESNLKPEL